MKKIFGFGVSFLLAFVLLVIPSTASAGPAKPISDVQILSVTQSGSTGVIAVRTQGQLNYNNILVDVNGSRISITNISKRPTNDGGWLFSLTVNLANAPKVGILNVTINNRTGSMFNFRIN